VSEEEKNPNHINKSAFVACISEFRFNKGVP
jgi:hypothetical protein